MKRKQKIFVLFATQHGDDSGGDFAMAVSNKHELPWQTPHTEDMKIFRRLTMHNIVVMGYRTFKSLECKPLPNRLNIVVSNKPIPSLPGIPSPDNLVYVPSISEALYLAGKDQSKDVFFIGGKNLLADVFSMYMNGRLQLDGIYHSKIAPNWPKSGARGEIFTFHIPRAVLDQFRVVGSAVAIPNGISYPTVRCFLWVPSQEQQESITQICSHPDHEECDNFFPPRPKNDKSEPKEITPEQIETIFTVMNKNAIEEAIKTPNVLERDRGMAVVDLEAYDKAVTEATASKESLRLMFEKGFAAKTQEAKSAPADKDATAVVCSDFVGVAKEIGELLVIKDAAYGSAFEKTKEIFKILFPAGLPVGAYDDALTIMRILDKICRLGVLCTNPEENKTAERTEDAWKDIAGYAIKALSAERKRASEDMTNK